MTSPTWHIRYAPSVIEKDIPHLDVLTQKRIKKSIETKLMSDPLRFGKPLHHSLKHLRSLRVGDYRVLYHIDHDAHVVSVAAIGHRKRVYED